MTDCLPQDASAAGATLSRRQVSAIVGVLSLAVFMSSLDLFIVNLAFPYISREYPGTSLGLLSWVLNGYTIVFAAVLVPAGRWADRLTNTRNCSTLVTSGKAASAGSARRVPQKFPPSHPASNSQRNV